MKTPVKTVTKDGKEAKEAFKAKGVAAVAKPGCGMANVQKNTNGTYAATVKCVNGDPLQNPSNTIPKGAKYYNSRDVIPDRGDISVYLPDSLNIDVNFLFPWAANQPDPLRLGGGVVKGTLTEGAQRAGLSAGDPLFAPILVTEWINGTTINKPLTCVGNYGFTLVEGAKVFGLVLKDPVTGLFTMKYMALSLGSCLDI